jgi:dephospho-CoA kinase
MVALGLTGGIGSGKSTVARLFAEHGLRIVDADEIARRITAPGTPIHDRLVDHFGPDYVNKAGELDRRAVATLVFSDEKALRQLEAIVHPPVALEIREEVNRALRKGEDVIVDIPLLVETGGKRLYGLDVVVVVDAPEDVVLARLAERGMNADEARARIAAQADPAVRMREADAIIENSGTVEELAEMVSDVWRHIGFLGEGGQPLKLVPSESSPNGETSS